MVPNSCRYDAFLSLMILGIFNKDYDLLAEINQQNEEMAKLLELREALNNGLFEKKNDYLNWRNEKKLDWETNLGSMAGHFVDITGLFNILKSCTHFTLEYDIITTCENCFDINMQHSEIVILKNMHVNLVYPNVLNTNFNRKMFYVLGAVTMVTVFS